MSPLRLSIVLALALALLVGCNPSSSSSVPATGSMRMAVSVHQVLPVDVSRVTVTVSGADMAPLSVDLVITEGAWGGVIGDIPAGPGRAFLAQAFTASNALRYEGRAENVTVSANATGLVSLTLQEVDAPPPLNNEAPVVDSLVADFAFVAPGGTVFLAVSAHDPNAGDSVSFAWSAPAGTFSAPTQG